MFVGQDDVPWPRDKIYLRPSHVVCSSDNSCERTVGLVHQKRLYSQREPAGISRHSAV